ncbi:MAG: SpoIVB peptidase S55 domain-containing protein [Candidatus Krumholzibacteriia bacterium]
MTRTRTWGGAALTAALAALTLAAGSPAAAGPPTIAPEQIVPGMTGYGLSVFAGTAVDTFGVTVIGVQPNVRAQGSLIVVEVAGHGLETSSIAQGMSGSPVFIDGRLAGALAFGWGGALRPLAGVTPIAEMFAVPAGAVPDAAQLDAGAAPGWPPPLGGAPAPGLARALWPQQPLPAAQPAAPLLPRGWPDPVDLAAVLVPGGGAADGPGSWICRPAGTALPAAGGSAAGAKASAAPLALVPGGACAVPLVLGDALLGAVGTVTWVEDGRVWMFGHPFLQRGPVALPLATASILTVFPSRQMSFKLGAIGEVVGTVQRDQRAGLLGVLGQAPPLVPVQVRVAGPNGAADFTFEVADDPQLLPALVFWAAYNALLAGGDDASLQTVRLRARTRWEAPGSLGREGLEITAAAAGPGGAAELGPQLMAPLQILLTNPHRPVRLKEVSVDLETAPGLATARIVGLTGPTELPAVGGPLTVEVELEPRRGERLRLPVTLDVPAGLPAGPYRLVAASAADVFALEAMRAAGLFAPTSLDGTVRLLRSERSPAALTVALFAPGRGVVVAGQELDALPGSVARTVRRGTAADQRTLADTIVRHDAAVAWILEGHALLDLRAGRGDSPLTVEKRP